MKFSFFITGSALLLFSVLVFSCSSSSDYQAENLPYSSVRTANPLKGFAVWEGDGENGLPCSLEYIPVPFNLVLKDRNSCDFSALENRLNAAKERRHQAIVRFIIDDTGNASYLPAFLSSVTKYSYTAGSYTGYSPDYNSEELLSQIVYFIRAFGNRYDGDVRIANIETGLIGHWGEHHTYYCRQSGATVSDSTWNTFFSAFSEYFDKTCVSVRSPSHPGVADHSNLGYYNDMVYSDSDDDYFRTMLSSNPVLVERWKNSMVTGEFAPALQSSFLASCGRSSVFSKYKSRVQEFHVSSLLCNEAFYSSQGSPAVLAASNLLGYDFSLTSADVSLSGSQMTVSVSIKNQGIAPFYYRWPVKIALADSSSISDEFSSNWDIRSIAPGSTRTFSYTVNIPEGRNGFSVLLGIPNPMEGGYPVSFSNEGQDADVEGWLTIGICGN